MSEAETFQGALNRAQHAAQLLPQADYWVGIEGGIDAHHGEMMAFAWVVVYTPHLLGKSRTAAFPLPEDVVRLIHQGQELGAAVERFFQRAQARQSSGAVGILTDDVIDRTALYEQAVILALIPFKHSQR
jgi:inosine/xanthosine triphosphatase